jgi:phytoene dehydrogenase-like protein
MTSGTPVAANRSKATIVIGAGANGLAAAFYLAKAGRPVLVLERSDRVGGGAISGDIHPGFTGPTLTHEMLLHERIAQDMRLHDRGLEFLAAPADVTALSPDRAPFVLPADIDAAVRELSRHCPGEVEAYTKFVARRARFAVVLEQLLDQAVPRLPPPSFGEVWRLLQAGRQFRALGPREGGEMLRWLPMPIADLLTETFDDELLRVAVAGPSLSGVSMGPRSGGSVLLMLMRAAQARAAGGGRFVRGGPGCLTQAMAAAATVAGAEVRTGHAVDRILVKGGRVTGVIAGGQEIAAATVVSSADPKTTFIRLVEPDVLPGAFLARIGHYRSAGTLGKVNLALAALPRFRGVDEARALAGRVIVGPSLDDMERAFDHVKYGELSRQPWLDITIPSIADPSLAPPGQHVASIYVHHAPVTLRENTWREARPSLLDAVLRVLEQYAPGIGALVVAAQTISPADLETDYGFGGGHIFHGDMALDQLFSMRPVMGFARYDSPVAGLYLCGGGTHPGGFLTGTNGRLAAERVLRSSR